MNSFSQYLSPELTSALGWTFIHSLWQGCLLMILLMLGQKIFNLKSIGKYWSALITMSSLLVITAFTFYHYLSTSTVFADISNAPLLIVNDLKPFQDIQSWGFVEQYFPVIAWCWLIGVLFYAIRLCGGLVQVHRLKSVGVLPISKDWEEIFDKLLIKTKIDKTVKLLQSSKVSVPMVLGYFKPMILMPVGIMSGLSIDQVEAILLHELSHIKRHDFLVNIIQSIIEVIFYYHPVVWWLSSEIRKEREHCCDDQIIAHGVEKLTYVHALTNIGTINFTQNKLTMGLANNKNDLLNRIKRLVEGNDQSSTNFYSKGIPLLVLITVLMSFSWYHRDKPSVDHPGQIASIPISPLAELSKLLPKHAIIPIDTPETKRKHRAKTTIDWIDKDGEPHEITDMSFDNLGEHWEGMAERMEGLDEDFRVAFDIYEMQEHLNGLSKFVLDFDDNFNIDFKHEFQSILEIQEEQLKKIQEKLTGRHEFLDKNMTEERKMILKEQIREAKQIMKEQMKYLNQSFDFQYDKKLDTLPEIHKEHLMRAEAELVRVKEMLDNMHFDFIHRNSEELSEKQVQALKEEMKQMEHNMHLQMERMNNLQKNRLIEISQQSVKEEMEQVKKLQEEIHKMNSEFSTERMEKQIQEAQEGLVKQKLKMKMLEEKFEAYNKELIKQLKSDGYLKRGEKLENFQTSKSGMKVNGKKIDSKDIEKYNRLREKYLEE